LGIRINTIGQTLGHPRHDVYQLIIPGKKHGTVCVSAGIHGDENSGPMAILELLRKRPSWFMNGPRLILFPVVNPYGYDRGQRRNGQRLDLNRHFNDRPLAGEPRLIMSALKHETVDAFLSIHEDDELAQPYLYSYANSERARTIVRSVRNDIDKRFPVSRHQVIYGQRASRGLIKRPKSDGSFDERMHRDGVPVSLCLETPDKISFSDMIQLNIIVVHSLLHHSQSL